MCANQNLKPKIVASVALNKVRRVFNYFNGMLIILILQDLLFLRELSAKLRFIKVIISMEIT